MSSRRPGALEYRPRRVQARAPGRRSAPRPWSSARRSGSRRAGSRASCRSSVPCSGTPGERVVPRPRPSRRASPLPRRRRGRRRSACPSPSVDRAAARRWGAGRSSRSPVVGHRRRAGVEALGRRLRRSAPRRAVERGRPVRGGGGRRRRRPRSVGVRRSAPGWSRSTTVDDDLARRLAAWGSAGRARRRPASMPASEPRRRVSRRDRAAPRSSRRRGGAAQRLHRRARGRPAGG